MAETSLDIKIRPGIFSGAPGVAGGVGLDDGSDLKFAVNSMPRPSVLDYARFPSNVSEIDLSCNPDCFSGRIVTIRVEIRRLPTGEATAI